MPHSEGVVFDGVIQAPCIFIIEESMTTKLAAGKDVVRELNVVVQDGGARNLIVTVRSDGVLYIRAKGLQRQVMWKLDALYEKGIKEGRNI